ncbi:MAG: THUMP domain-containing protein [Candidatus Bathyarchaeia archaeon]
MSKIFFVLSGEHPTLPKAEVEAILKSESAPYMVVGEETQLLTLDLDPAVAGVVVERSAYARLCCREIFRCQAETFEQIINSAHKVSFKGFLKPKESFMVRVKRIRSDSKHIDTSALERMLGAAICRQVEGAWVSFESPMQVFLGFLTDGNFVFGLRLLEAEAKKFYHRTPRRKPFFHPSSLQPKLARCMVNLSRARVGQVVYDPFCGTGTVMVEAGLMGFETLGSDLIERMVKGAKLNLNSFKVKSYHLLVSDALNPPIHSVDSVVTDPPYGRSATTRGLTTASIVEAFLSKADSLLTKGGIICMASPKTVNIASIGERLGFKVIEAHQIRVHRSLTREIVVLARR